MNRTLFALIGAIAVCLFLSSPVFASVVINEFLANPSGSDSSEPNEWIELYNPDSNTVDVSGWTLDDEDGGTSPYTIASGSSIPVGGFAVFEKSVTGVGLNNSGDTVRLFDATDHQIDGYTYSSASTDVSIGRSSDGGGDWMICASQTRGGANNCPTLTLTPTQSLTPTHSSSPTNTPTNTATPIKTPTATKKNTPTPTPAVNSESSGSSDAVIDGIVLGDTINPLEGSPSGESTTSGSQLRALAAASAMVATGLALIAGVLVWQKRNPLR